MVSVTEEDASVLLTVVVVVVMMVVVVFTSFTSVDVMVAVTWLPLSQVTVVLVTSLVVTSFMVLLLILAEPSTAVLTWEAEVH